MDDQQLLLELRADLKETRVQLDRIENGQIRIEETIWQHSKDLDHLNTLVWKGGDNPPMTERLAVTDKLIQETKERLHLDIVRLETALNNRNQVVWSVVVALLSILLGAFITSASLTAKSPTQLLESGGNVTKTTTESTKEQIKVLP